MKKSHICLSLLLVFLISILFLGNNCTDTSLYKSTSKEAKSSSLASQYKHYDEKILFYLAGRFGTPIIG